MSLPIPYALLTFLLAALGGIASLLVARWTLSLIAAILPPEAVSTLTMEISDNEQLSRVLTRIGQLPNVSDVRRKR